MNYLQSPSHGEVLAVKKLQNFSSTPNDLVLQERLRQAKLSFNLALIMTAATAMIGLLGISLLFAEKVQAGAITTTGGIAFSACCFKLVKDANDRLDRLTSELDEDNRAEQS